MKNFDLNACGVQEMNAAEVMDVNGGRTAPWNECRRPEGYDGPSGGSTGGGFRGMSWLDIFLYDCSTQMQWLR